MIYIYTSKIMLSSRLIRLGTLTFLLMLAIMYTQLLADDKINFPYDLSISASITHTNPEVFYILGTLSSALLVAGMGLQLREVNEKIVQLLLTIVIALSLCAFMFLKYFNHDPLNTERKEETIHFGIASFIILGMGAIILVLAVQRKSYFNAFISFMYVIAMCAMIGFHFMSKEEKSKKEKMNLKKYERYSRGFSAAEISASILFVASLVMTL